jgi:proteasome accessory factor C
VTADDERSGEIRTFRIDRIESIEPTGVTPTPSAAPLPVPGDWFTDGSIPRVTVRLAPAARWVIERYPVDNVDGHDEAGWVTATMAIASERWFTRTLVRLGANAEVVEPDEWAGAARAAVARVLERYRRS